MSETHEIEPVATNELLDLLNSAVESGMVTSEFQRLLLHKIVNCVNENIYLRAVENGIERAEPTDVL